MRAVGRSRAGARNHPDLIGLERFPFSSFFVRLSSVASNWLATIRRPFHASADYRQSAIYRETGNPGAAAASRIYRLLIPLQDIGNRPDLVAGVFGKAGADRIAGVK